jgi:hypothetical protein
MVEFALVAPVFFLLLFAVIEGGRFVFYYETLANATREGARYAIVHGWKSYCPSGPMPPSEATPTSCYDADGSKVAQRVEQSAFGVMGAAGSPLACAAALCVEKGSQMWPDGNNGPGQKVHVQAVYTYRILLPLPFPPISMSAESTLVINN